MIRRACYALLLTCCTVAFAEPLYKWVEADGSITFSPDKPPAGIDFQVIEAASGITASSPKTTVEPALAASVAKPTPSVSINNAQTSQRSISATSQQNSTVNRGAGIWDTETQPRAVPTRTTQILNTATVTSGSKNKCEDLRKRVVSLERRLKAQLTPEDMDNTVVHMSKYQRSYDKFCVQ